MAVLNFKQGMQNKFEQDFCFS